VQRPLLCLTLLAVIGCAIKEPQYTVRRDGPRLVQTRAEQELIERGLEQPKVSSLDVPLAVLSASLPPYPRQVRSDDVQGNVRVFFTIEADGSVSNPATLGTSDPTLAGLCTEAIAKWRFKPITRAGKPTTLRTSFLFKFALEGQE
jgi:TonB family protein